MYKSKICFADRRVITWLMVVFFFLGLTIPCNAFSTTSAIPQVLSKKVTEPDKATMARLMESYGRLPLSFEANHGQADEKVKFLSRGSGYNLFLTSTEAVLSLRKAQSEDKAARGSALHKADKPEPATVVSMKLVGANADPRITGANQLPGKVNYFLGKDPKKWRTNIPTCARVKYTNIYPGIDLVFYGQGQKLEYDFIVAPGADPETIALCFGQTRLKIEQNGDLALDAKGGELRLQQPLIYQDIDGIRKPVPGGYVLHPVKNEKQTHRVGFKVAAYDRTRPLVIDPVLVYSTYLGGNDSDIGHGIAVDATGNCYVTGNTSSIDFPTQDPLYPNNAGGDCDVFVTSLSPTGDALIYSTYLGGSNGDYGRDIAVDATGNCYVTGCTYSTDFPTQNPLYPNNAGGDCDAFVSSLSPAGDALIYSTYLGGGDYDLSYGIAVDATGNCYVTGCTYSTDFPTQNPLYPNNAGGYDAFVSSLSPAGDFLVYSTYLGGSNGDYGRDIAVDATGNCYVTGNTYSTDFPTQNPLYPNNAGGYDAFVSSLSPAGDFLVYSTYLGGSSNDCGSGIAVDATGNCYVTGCTNSTDFPTQNPLYPNLAGSCDAFVSSLSPAGDALAYSTYLGGSDYDEGSDIAVDATGNCYARGFTNSMDFPTQDSLYPNNAGGYDVFVTSLSPAGDALMYSTYLGGSDHDSGGGIAVDAIGNCYVTGYTESTDFPTQDPLYPNLAGSHDAFVCKISSVSPEPLHIASISPTQVEASTFDLTINGSNFDDGAVDQIYWKADGHFVGQGTVLSRSSTQIVVREYMEGIDPGTYVVKVKNSDGQLSNGVDLEIISEPSIATYFSYPVGYPVKNVNRQYYNVPRVSGAYCDFLDPYYGDDDDDHLEETLHPGEDWNGGSGIQDYGDPVYAVADGEVIWAEDGGNGWGYIILIKHTLPCGSFVYSQYAHLLEIIRDEGNVRRGEKIGTIGNGSVPGKNYRTWSPHLHFEIRRSNMEGVSASYWPYGHNKDADWINSHYYNPSDVGSYTYPGPPPAEGFIEDHLSPYDRIVDNLDPEFNKGGGNWELYEDTYRNYYYISDTNPGNCWAEWRPNLPVSGQYEAFVCFWAYSDQSTSVPYTVCYDGGQATINIDQLQTFDNSVFRWHQISLGTFNFQRGNSGYVRLSGAPNNTNIDTIWFKCVATDVSVTLVPDATVIPRGGTLGLDVTITNNTDKFQIVGFATNITLPNGTIFPPSGYLFGPFPIVLNPSQSKSGHLSHTISGNAPIGAYTYHGYVGKPGEGIIDEDQFDFEVTATKQVAGPEDWKAVVDKAFTARQVGLRNETQHQQLH